MYRLNLFRMGLIKRMVNIDITIKLLRRKKENEGWSDKYKKSIDCNNPKGFFTKDLLLEEKEGVSNGQVK